MKKTDKLFELIKSLTKSEKRFFKIHSNRHVIGENNNYVLLFDAVDKMQIYNEKQLKKEFAEEKFVSRIAVTKAYLYDLILKSMSAFHQQNNSINQIYEYLQEVHFLFNKNLIEQANAILIKAIKLADQFNHCEIKLEITEWQKRIIEASNYKILYNENLKNFFDVSNKLNEEINLLNNFWYLQAQLYHQHNASGIVKNKEDFNIIEDIFSARFMQLDDKELSFKSLLLKNKIYATYFFQIRDYESCYKYIKNIVSQIETLENHSIFLTKEYMQAISNLLNVTKALNKEEEHKIYLKKLDSYYHKKEEYKSEIVQIKILEAYHYHKMSLLNNEDAKSRLAHLNLLNIDLIKYESKISNISKSIIYYFAFHICFDAEDFKSAKIWLNKIDTIGSKHSRPDIYTFSKVLLPITLLELNQIEECKLKLKELFVFKMKTKNKTKFDRLLIENLKSLQNLKQESELIDWMKNYKKQLATLMQDPFEKKIFDYFKFVSWLTSKIENKSYSAIINKSAVAS